MLTFLVEQDFLGIKLYAYIVHVDGMGIEFLGNDQFLDIASSHIAI